jgi:hypothetical protein
MVAALTAPALGTAAGPSAPKRHLRAAASPGVNGSGAAMREQDRRNRTLWIDRKKFMAAGPPPGEADVARMVQEFLSRGGQVTRCATAHALPVNNGAGREAGRWTV